MSANELDELRVDYDRLQAEHIRVCDQSARRERDLREWEKRVVSARRRELEGWLDNLAGLYVERRVEAARRGGLGELFYRVSKLADRPKPTEIQELRRSAVMIENVVRAIVPESAEQFYERQRAEVKRLRAYITTAAQELHAKFGEDVAGPTYVGCTCAGCELIVGMDVLGDEEPAPNAPRSDG